METPAAQLSTLLLFGDFAFETFEHLECIVEAALGCSFRGITRERMRQRRGVRELDIEPPSTTP